MSIGYYSDEYCEDLISYAKARPKGADYFYGMRKKIQRHGIHFQLPEGGYVLPKEGDEITIDTDIMRPPFPVTVLEYSSRFGDLNTGEMRSTKRLVLAVDEGDSVALMPAYYVDDWGKWVPPIITWRFHYNHRFTLSRTKHREITEDFGIAYGEAWPGAVKEANSALMPYHSFLEYTFADINQELSVYIDMCQALASYDVEFSEQAPDEKMRKMRRLKGKKPLFTYKVITITGKKSQRRTGNGTHASPVAHLRRGHWRHYKSGKRVWIEPSMVNGVDGMVAKDYKLESRA